MNASDITFGIEIECTVPVRAVNDGRITIGGYGYCNGTQVQAFPEGWKAQSDGSLTTEPRRRAVEIVSPPLKGVDGLRQVGEVLAKLKEWGTKVNATCGFHVHVGWAYETDAAALKRLSHLVANLEKGIYATTGTKNREQGSYCKSIRVSYRNMDFAALSANPRTYDRYQLLNLKNLVDRRRPTVEFRAFAGTLNFTKIAAYVRLCVGLVERAMNTTRPVAWDARPVNTERKLYSGRGTPGQVEMIRMMYALGWFKGDVPQTYGDLSADGLPTLTSGTQIMLKMAAKYDGVENVPFTADELDGE